MIGKIRAWFKPKWLDWKTYSRKVDGIDHSWFIHNTANESYKNAVRNIGRK